MYTIVVNITISDMVSYPIKGRAKHFQQKRRQCGGASLHTQDTKDLVVKN